MLNRSIKSRVTYKRNLILQKHKDFNNKIIEFVMCILSDSDIRHVGCHPRHSNCRTCVAQFRWKGLLYWIFRNRAFTFHYTFGDFIWRYTMPVFQFFSIESFFINMVYWCNSFKWRTYNLLFYLRGIEIILLSVIILKFCI